MTKGKKKKYAGSFVGFMGAVWFFGTREGHEHRWLRGMRDEEKRKSGREREWEGTRERGIITTITLPPWDRFREEKGEEEDGEKEEDGRNGLVVANEEEEGGKPRYAHRGHLALYPWPGAMISAAFCFVDYEREFYALRIILAAPRQKERDESSNRNALHRKALS